MRLSWPALLAVSLLTGACAGVADVAPEAAGLGAGAGAGVLTANPLVGVAVAIATRFAAAEAVGYVEGEQQTRVQHAIAASGGAAATNQVVTWATEENPWFDAMFGRVGGQLEVVRDFGSLIICRELLYTVAASSNDVRVAWPEAAIGPVLAAVICNGGQGWRWAVSRPATEATW